MDLAVMSDLHLDYNKTKDFPFNKLPAADVCVIAGDLAEINQTRGFNNSVTFLKELKKIYKHILCIPGNHDAWYGDFAKLESAMDALAKETEISVLKTGAVQIINGQRFMGDTLWYEEHPDMKNYGNYIDFRRINVGSNEEIFAKGRKFKEFIKANATSEDVIISHILPTFKAVEARFKNAPTNMFFVNDCEDLIASIKPKLWIFGHTHFPFDFKLGDTRMYCNPLAYPNEGSNPDFAKKVLVKI